MQNSPVSFTSRINFVNVKTFNKMVESFPSEGFVKSPWTVNEITKGKQVFTTEVADCTCGLLSDGKDAVMFHVDPSSNPDFKQIEKVLSDKIDLKNPNIRGFLLGCKANWKYSSELFTKFQEFMEKNNVLCSVFKGHKSQTSTSNIAYDLSKDEITVFNNYVGNRLEKEDTSLLAIIKEEFNEVVVVAKDVLLGERGISVKF